MDLASFLALLETQSLFFRRADKFEDKLEASLPIGQHKAIERRKEEMRLNGASDAAIELFFIKDREWNIWFRENTYLNCWHINEKESIGMWKLYNPMGHGICIQSTYQKLQESFSETYESIQIGTLEYIDLSREDVEIPEDNKFYPFIHKDSSFTHENEIRAVVCDRLTEHGGRDINQNPQFSLGRNIPINLNELVEKIYVTPSSGQWFADLVSSIIKKYEFQFQVSQSELIREPFFG